MSLFAININNIFSTCIICFLFHRAKKIQNKATINESSTDRLIRELKEENARLLAMLKKQGGGDTSGMIVFLIILTNLYGFWS